jgi:hypothetical protein
VNDLRWEPVSSVAYLFHPAGYRVTTRTQVRRGATMPVRKISASRVRRFLPPLLEIQFAHN